MNIDRWGEVGRELIDLSRQLGAEHRDLAILGEGNTSARLGEETFLVKASGSHLGTLSEADLVECRFEPLLELMGRDGVGDAAVDAALMSCRVDPEAKRPSVEALFHAYLLSLPGIRFVGHTHPVAVNAILCSARAEEFAKRRIFPDEIVCCGPESVLVPYSDPGVWLAQAMREGVESYGMRNGGVPRVILLKNHGLVSLGGSVPSVWAGTAMAVKAARIFAGAMALGGPDFLDASVVERIGSRSDEHYRQRALRL
jgi:rhamnose utilization protein RhaD (predicted bifunctional aldolase and dehydrogenase)